VNNNSQTGETSRRGFVKKLFFGFGALIAAEVAAVIFSFAGKSRKRRSDSESARYFEAGTVDDFAANSVTPFRAGRFYLVRQADGGFLALSIVCPHLGCSVNWKEKEGGFVCPCHASRFDLRGAVLNPPAARPLDSFPVKIENNVVKVNTAGVIKRKSMPAIQAVYPES